MKFPPYKDLKMLNEPQNVSQNTNISFQVSPKYQHLAPNEPRIFRQTLVPPSNFDISKMNFKVEIKSAKFWKVYLFKMDKPPQYVKIQN